jgi:hypothetical protein
MKRNSDMVEKSSLHQQPLNIKLALIGVLFVGIITAILISIAIYANNARRDRVIASYTNETQQLISMNQQAFETLFNTAFDACLAEYQLIEASRDIEFQPSVLDCKSTQELLKNINFGQTRDTSAIAYLRFADGKIDLIEASGNYFPPKEYQQNHKLSGSNEKKALLFRYLSEGQAIPMWDDYINYIPGKEVIVPVESNGQKIGYIFRGVIEK